MLDEARGILAEDAAGSGGGHILQRWHHQSASLTLVEAQWAHSPL